MSEDEDYQAERKGVYLFGRDLSQIPCFRNSFLYGIGSGIGMGLVYFMFTSKVVQATKVGYGSFLFTTLSYWFYCRYNFSKTKFELMKAQYMLQEKLLREGTVAEIKSDEFERTAPTVDLPESYSEKI